MRRNFEMGAAERRHFQKAILREFLTRAEALGWVSVRGWCRRAQMGRAMAYWAGVRHVQDTLNLPLFDDAFFDRLTTIDPIKTARGMHVELCLLERRPAQ